MRVKKSALDGVAEELTRHYSRVRDFAHEVLKSNPHNTVKICGTRLNDGDVNRFKRLYLCFAALKNGWKSGCRPLLGLDGCFLKSVCGGQLLSAVGRDGNNCMYPVCFAVVESENTDSWRWFIELMKNDLDLDDGIGLTLISDQQKVLAAYLLYLLQFPFSHTQLFNFILVQGLENAVKEILPKAEHRFCTRHIYSNLRKK